MMKKRVVSYKYALAAALCLFCFSNLGFAKTYEFDGIAKPFLTTTLPYGYNDAYRGIVQWTAMPGEIVQGPIYDKDGKVVRPGDVLIQLNTEYRESVVKTNEDNIKIAQANLEWTKSQFERYKKLAKTSAISLQDFQQSKNDYLSAVATLDSAKAALIQANQLYELTTYRAQFDAIVDEVLMPAGLLSGEPATITLSQIEPIAIDLKMPREQARKINVTTPIKIYPTGSDESVGAMAGFYTLTKDGIRIYADNYLHPAENNNLPIVRNVRTVIRMDLSIKEPVELSINDSAIKKDNKGTFVWLAVGAKDMQPGVGIDPVLTLKKVYVTAGNLTHKVDNHWNFIELKDPATLKQYDMVVDDAPANAKDGDKVYWDREKLLFMPNDPIKVEIKLP